MNVKQLIAQLKELPGNLQVHVAAHDNNDWETQGIPHRTSHQIKSDFVKYRQGLLAEDQRRFDDMPDEWVVLAC